VAELSPEVGGQLPDGPAEAQQRACRDAPQQGRKQDVMVGEQRDVGGDFVARRCPFRVAREARISDEDYAAIIDQLASARGLIERLPGTFSPMDEEALRDVLLVILDNQFGPAGREMLGPPDPGRPSAPAKLGRRGHEEGQRLRAVQDWARLGCR
jgi:hypothetical protein